VVLVLVLFVIQLNGHQQGLAYSHFSTCFCSQENYKAWISGNFCIWSGTAKE